MKLRETFIMQFSGGLYDTQTHTAPAELDWPLPEIVYAVDEKKNRIDYGRYVKIFESKGDTPSEGEARGAMYEWLED
jgi:hypothetical protein